MMKTEKRISYGWWGLFICLLLLSAIGMIKTVWLSADIDESYALTMAVRMAKGDRLLLEMWEPHQFSAILYMPFVWLYLAFAGATAEGIVVFMRLLGFLVQALLSFALYKRVRKVSPIGGLFAAFSYLNFTPKMIQSPEFTTLFYWAMTALILLLLCLSDEVMEAGGKKRTVLLIGSGLCLSAMVLCYPATVLVFLFVLLWLYRGKKSDAVCVLLTCVAAALLFFAGLLLGGDLPGALKNLPNVLSDESHTQSFYLLWKEHLTALVSMLVGTAAILILLFCGRPVWDKEKKKGLALWSAALILQAVWMVISFHDFRGKAYYDYLPVVLQLFVVCLAFSYEEKGKESLLVTWMIPVLSTLCILGMSNLPAAYSTGFLMPAILLILPRLFVFLTQSGKKRYMAVAICFALVMLSQLFMVRLCLVRFSGNQRRDVFETYYKVNHGPLAGIRLGAEDWKHHDELLHVYVDELADDDVVLYVGADYFLYSLLGHGQLGTGNTISTPAFGNQLMAYYERFPERIPTVLLVEEMYVHDYRQELTKEPFAGFIDKWFDLEGAGEYGSVLICRRKTN